MHFIISSAFSSFFGTPNGQANTQLEQPMHLDVLAECTTPKSS
ncbi:hypothetical protein C900_02276 [Fulvivirga imtechensis AK7]|uniref:Uncharacterized protein n=1 Tax=Fulvivirga imtechensis AK7 TaxID=1237149 RepID=L8JRV5_9BACT|nr:hypothetical protein C900_02276 [Fulvivirga imtechensis AK7]